jgi:hypothetical protein
MGCISMLNCFCCRLGTESALADENLALRFVTICLMRGSYIHGIAVLMECT